MEIRKLEELERADTRPLYETVFSEDSRAFVDYYYTEKTKDNQIYTVIENGEIRAMLHLNPYSLMVNRVKKNANYIVAVATQKEYRGRGYMGALLKRALNDMYQEGEAFTFLMPAAEAIYTPYDFRTVYEQNPLYYQDGEVYPKNVQVAEVTEADLSELSRAANQDLASKYQVYAFRDEAYYRRLWKECESDGGRLMVYRTDGHITDCRIAASEPQGEKRPKIMVRIVDVRRLLMSLSVCSFVGMCFRVTDPVIEENNRCILLTGTEYSGVMLMEGSEHQKEGTITIGALTSLIFGAASVEGIEKEEGVELSVRLKEELKKLIPLSRIYLNEIV